MVKQSHRHSASNDKNGMLTKVIDGEEFIHNLMVVIRVAQLEEELEDTKGVIRIRCNNYLVLFIIRISPF
jgi:hypothetical protein